MVGNANFRVIHAIRISVLALDGLFDTGLTAALDTLALANKFSAQQMGGTPCFDVSLVGVQRKVRQAQGLGIPVQAITPDLKPDWVIIPALATATPELLVPALGRPDVTRAKAQMLKWRAEGAQIAAACIGTFLLAESGLLEVGHVDGATLRTLLRGHLGRGVRELRADLR
jgi:transcriptional regulator GlxA family with amidase domain